MRLLADENFPAAAVEALRSDGHDVLWIRTDRPGATDREVLALATAARRLLLTFDKDFGELAFRSGLPATSGVVLFRIRPRSPGDVAHAARVALHAAMPFEGHFTVIEEHRVRSVPLPSSNGPSFG